MSAQGVSPREAVDLAVARCAVRAGGSRAARAYDADQIERSLLARALVESCGKRFGYSADSGRGAALDREAVARARPTVCCEDHSRDAIVNANSPPGVDERARGVAQKIRDAVQGAPSAEAFRERAGRWIMATSKSGSRISVQ